MVIPKLERKFIIDALKFIDKNKVPKANVSTEYLLDENGNKYPPKYVVAVAVHLANGTKNISTDSFTSIAAKNYLESLNFNVKTVDQVKLELSITAEDVESTDKRFTISDLYRGDKYEPLDAYFRKANGDVIKRSRMPREWVISGQTLPKIACQVFEKQLIGLSAEEKKEFPICKYRDDPLIKGIFANEEEFEKERGKTIERMTYYCSNGQQLVIYCWNIFSTIIFVQECLKRFGEPGDQFILTYREKSQKKATATEEVEVVNPKENTQQFIEYQNPFSSMLVKSKNIIFRGAPGTGKSFLAKKIAADIISGGAFVDYNMLTNEQKKQVEFVQFHPSYDYTDFVEGLRPKVNDDGTMGFELQDGIFKKFVERAKTNYENSHKSQEMIEKELSVQEAVSDFFSNIELGVNAFQTVNGNEFTITSVDDKHVKILIPGNATINKLTLNLDEIKQMLASGRNFEKVKDISNFFGKTFANQAYSYNFILYKAIKAKKRISSKTVVKQEKEKNYIFIIDEINRGEISKIFGELFFAIDPGYRGKAGEISTQYSNLHSDPNEKFYIPENVYIIGTMNDIDRSVDSFDFAMRRRFRFIELKADKCCEMLNSLSDDLKRQAIEKMTALNEEIAKVDDLNENYQIGASYFLKLKTLNFDQLWTDCLQPLLQEYIQGMNNENELMKQFKNAYDNPKPIRSDGNETA